MAEPDERTKAGAARIAAAFAVHIFTAAGAALALLALLAAVERRWTLMFAWLGVALIVDAVDGTFARLLHVRALAPRWSGDVLDLVVDILTYVFVPAYALVASGLLPPPLAVPLGIAIMITGALYFADTQMKSADNHFVGFPAVWNLAAFYLFLLRPHAWLTAGIVLALCILTFAPLCFVHPFRVVRLRMLNLAMLVGGFLLGVAVLAYGMAPPTWMTVALCAVGVYFISIGLLRLSPTDKAS